MLPDHAPRGYGRIMDRAFELYRANFRTIALASLLVVFPFAMLVGVTQVFSARGFLQLAGAMSESSSDAFFAQIEQIQTLSLLSNAVTPLFLLARTYLVAALLAAAPLMLGGQHVGVRQFLKGGTSRFLMLLLVTLAVSASISFSAIFLLVPALILWARLRVAHIATVVEAAPIDRAFARSWNLTRGRFWRTVGFAIVLAVISVVMEAAVDSPAVIRQLVASIESPDAVFAELSPGWKTFEGVLAASATALIAPFVELCWFFFYLDLRARAEGMDLVTRATDIAGRAAARRSAVPGRSS